MKKAGIIIGLVFIIAAIGIFGIAQVISNKSDKEIEVVEDIEENPVVEVVVETEEPTPIPVQEPTPPVEKEIIKTSIMEIDNIPGHGKEYEEIVVISSKKLMLIDEAVGSKGGKSLAFVFNVMTDSNRVLKLFIAETAYDSYEVGDRLKVSYKIITNDVGTEFPLIKSVNSTD